jgi:hypothetical protein
LLGSNMPVSKLKTLKEQGWSLTKNDKDLIVYI